MSLLSGDSLLTGQIYITPHILCVYTITGSKEVKLKMELNTVERVIYGHCANSKVAAPTISQAIPVGEKPNVVQVLLYSQVMHTFMNVAADELDELATLLHLTWDVTCAHPAPTMPVPPNPSETHTSLGLHQSEPIVGSSKASVINGTEKVASELVATVHYAGFLMGSNPILLDHRRIQHIAKCSSAPHPDPLIKVPVLTPIEALDDKVTGIVLYTDDGFMHQFYGLSDIQLLYNQLVYCHSLANGFTPVYW